MVCQQKNRAVFVWSLAMFVGMVIGSDATQAVGDDDLPPLAMARIASEEDVRRANGIYRLQYSPDGKWLAARNRNNDVSIYNTKNNEEICKVSGHDTNWIETIDFSPDSQLFVTAAGSGEKVKIWETQTGELKSEFDIEARAAYFSADGNQLRILAREHVETVSWPDLELVSRRKWRSEREQAYAMSLDGRQVVTCEKARDNSYNIKILNVETGKKIGLENAPSIIKTATFSPDGNWIAVAYHRHNVFRLWNMRDLHHDSNWLVKHKEAVQSLAFSADNRWLASGSWDETSVVWDLSTRQPVHQFGGHSEHVNAVALSPTLDQIASGASGTTDTSILLWKFRSTVLPPLTKKQLERYQDFANIWNDLGNESARISLASTRALLDGKEKYLRPLVDAISEDISQSSTEVIERALKQLDAPHFSVRESATRTILALRAQAHNQLQRILRQNASPEVRYRIRKILAHPVERPALEETEIRRWARIVLALEWMESPGGDDLLLQISQGHPDFVIAQQATAALERKSLEPK